MMIVPYGTVPVIILCVQHVLDLSPRTVPVHTYVRKREKARNSGKIQLRDLATGILLG